MSLAGQWDTVISRHVYFMCSSQFQNNNGSTKSKQYQHHSSQEILSKENPKTTTPKHMFLITEFTIKVPATSYPIADHNHKKATYIKLWNVFQVQRQKRLHHLRALHRHKMTDQNYSDHITESFWNKHVFQYITETVTHVVCTQWL